MKQLTFHPLKNKWVPLTALQCNILLLAKAGKLHINWATIEEFSDDTLEDMFPANYRAWLWGADYFDVLFNCYNPRTLKYLRYLYDTWPTPIIGGEMFVLWIQHVQSIYNVHEMSGAELDIIEMRERIAEMRKANKAYIMKELQKMADLRSKMLAAGARRKRRLRS